MEAILLQMVWEEIIPESFKEVYTKEGIAVWALVIGGALVLGGKKNG